MNREVGIFFAAFCATAALQAATLMVETEAFQEKGGWVIDQQFMDQMGSSFLLAHGLGIPVADAKTTLSIPEKGNYRVLARTRNWVAHWSTKAAAGEFRIAINGKPLQTTLGTGKATWNWREAGTIALEKGPITLALQDLTGFDGRCDAIVLTTDPKFTPVNEVKALDAFRGEMGVLFRDPETKKSDFIVVGGGVAGTCAAISAARLGLNVTLIQDRPVLGGCNSSEVRVHLGGRINIGPYPKLGDVVSEIGPAHGGNAQPASRYEDQRKLDVVAAEKNIHLVLGTRAIAIEKEGNKITAVIGRNIQTGAETRFTAPLIADCTGDGSIGMLAGAAYRYGRESKAETGEPSARKQADSITMGSSVQWYSGRRKAPTTFPKCAWQLPFTDNTCERVKMGEWTWETGMNFDQINDFERIRDYGMLVVYSNWSFLKNSSKFKNEYTNLALDWVAYIAGKRESRRLMGDLVLKEQDLVNRVQYPDGTACSTWTIDLHYPDPKNTKNFPGTEFKSIALHKTIYPYPIPYRCLYSKNIENLFMAGRNISVTHVALGTIRVMRTTGMMGEVVGMAASICKKNNCSPRGVYTSHLDELKKLMAKGIGTGKPQPPQRYNMGGTLMREEFKKDRDATRLPH